MKKACPRLTFNATALTPNGYQRADKHVPPGATGLRISAYADSRPVGELSVRVEAVTRSHPMAKATGSQEFLEPGWIEVPARYQRCGIGEQLYTYLAKLAKASKIPLASSFERSERSEGFWAKQHAKGRAVCLPNEPDYVSKKGRWDQARGHVEWADEPWPCWRYVLKSGKTDLSGAKRRRRARR